jgi:predicted O-methyltransferase YrrM
MAAVPAPLKHRAKQLMLDRRFIRVTGVSSEELAEYRTELESLEPVIAGARDRWLEEAGRARPRGHAASFGDLDTWPAGRLYALVRAMRPDIIVETGVCNGVSSAVILKALGENGHGRLQSIDLPEYADGSNDRDHWEGKLGAIVPAGKQSGWLIPDDLRDRWTLTTGRSQDHLPRVLDEEGAVDIFIHDSEHSYECMSFELRAALEHLRPGGWLICDDASWTTAFDEIVAERGLRPINLGGGMLAARV